MMWSPCAISHARASWEGLQPFFAAKRSNSCERGNPKGAESIMLFSIETA